MAGLQQFIKKALHSIIQLPYICKKIKDLVAQLDRASAF